MELKEGELQGRGKQRSAAATTGMFMHACQSLTCMSIYYGGTIVWTSSWIA